MYTEKDTHFKELAHTVMQVGKLRAIDFLLAGGRRKWGEEGFSLMAGTGLQLTA